jgi:hypothetical protein
MRRSSCLGAVSLMDSVALFLLLLVVVFTAPSWVLLVLGSLSLLMI